MARFVHVARILPGGKQKFLAQVKNGFEAGRDGLKALGFRRVTSFLSTEVGLEGDGLLVTVYEADDPSVIERFHALEPVRQQEGRAHGVLVADHDHTAVPRNTPFLDLDLTD